MYKSRIKRILRKCVEKRKHEVAKRELVSIPASFDVIESSTDTIQESVYNMTATQFITSKYLTMVTVLLCSISVCMCLIYLPRLIETYYSNRIKYTRWALLLNIVAPSGPSMLPFSLGRLASIYNWFLWII